MEEEPDLLDILKMFIQRLPGMLTKICETYENKNYDKLKELIHDLKGTSGNFGYQELYELSQQIEDAVREERFTDISDLLIEVEKICQRVLHGFKSQPTILTLAKK